MNDESSVFVRACCVFPSLFGGESVYIHVSVHLQVANNASCLCRTDVKLTANM